MRQRLRDLEELKAEYNNAQKSRSQLLDTSSEEIHAQRLELQRLSDEVIELRTIRRELTTELAAERRQRNGDAKAAERKMEIFTTDLASRAAELSAARKIEEDLRRQVSDMESKCRRLTFDLESSKSDNKHLQAEIDSLQHRLASAESLLSELKLKEQEQARQKKALEVEKQNARNLLNEGREKMSTLKNEALDDAKRIKSLEEECKAKDWEICEKKLALDALRKSAQEVEEKYQRDKLLAEEEKRAEQQSWRELEREWLKREQDLQIELGRIQTEVSRLRNDFDSETNKSVSC